MAEESRSILKTYFETGDIPTEEQFGNLIDSYIHRLDDGLTIYDPGITGQDRFRLGIEILTPANPLGISAEGPEEGFITLHNSDTTASWNILQNTLQGTTNYPGFNIEKDLPAGNLSRLFIKDSNGYVGLGTIDPIRAVHVENTNADSVTALRLSNLAASLVNSGWSMGHEHNGALSEKSGALTISEEDPGFAETGSERLTILSGTGNMGVNEPLPDAQLHVTRSLADPDEQVQLLEGTGVFMVGPSTQNVTISSEDIQARSGAFDGTGGSLTVSAGTLNMQRYGGDILFHANRPFEEQAVLTGDGNMGLGVTTPIERMELDGAIKIGLDSGTTATAGTMRWNGLDFEGYDGNNWLSLSAGGGKWLQVTGTDDIYYDLVDANIGIGTDTPSQALDIFDDRNVSQSNSTTRIVTNATTSGTGPLDERAALEVSCSGAWSTNSSAKNIGLYVSNVSGQDANANLAALLNGNVAIGEPSDDLIGTDGTNVLGMVAAVVPTDSPASNGIQVYADDNGTGGEYALNIRNSNDEIISLFRGDVLTAEDATAPDTGDTPTDDVIINMRTRIAELESRLQAIGLLD
jgi:hypothetical protein